MANFNTLAGWDYQSKRKRQSLLRKVLGAPFVALADLNWSDLTVNVQHALFESCREKPKPLYSIHIKDLRNPPDQIRSRARDCMTISGPAAEVRRIMIAAGLRTLISNMEVGPHAPMEVSWEVYRTDRKR